MKQYELDSRNEGIPLNKTAGRFYFEKFINNFSSNKDITKLLFNGTTDNKQSKEIFKRFVCIINLETNAYCNRHCHYCPLNIFERKNNINIDDKLFLKIINELESIQYSSTISLNLYNEPLSDTKIFERIKIIKTRLKNVFLRFNSNGDFLDIATLKKLESCGLDSINITLHTTKINTYNDTNSKEKIDKFYQKLKLDKPQYIITSNKNITSNIQFGTLNMIVNTTNWDLYGNDRGGVVSNLSIKHRTFPCVKIFREFSIDYKGRVFPCCNIFPDDPKNEQYIFGDVNNENIFDIFSSKIWAKWRKDLFATSLKLPPCNSCNDGYIEPTIKDDSLKRLEILDFINKGEI